MPKLKIGSPNNRYEQEADRVAEKVVKMSEPQPTTSAGHDIQRKCGECEEEEIQRQPEDEEEIQRQEDEEEEEPPQLKELPGKTQEATTNVESQIHGLKGGGLPLSETTRAYFEPRFGHDFSGVRVHTDSSSAGVARSVNARAFTRGSDVVFGSGEYSPGTQSGQRLLAHELTHVVQQNKTSSPTIHRKIDKVTKSGCSVELEMGIGIYGSRANSSLATKWQNWINTLWNAKAACHGNRTGTCDTRVKAKVNAHPTINWWWKVPESNSAFVKKPGYRSKTNILIDSGDWAVNEDDRSIAHETGHLLGQGDKYWNLPFMGQRSMSGYVNDIMANYYKDPGPTKYGPALSRILEDHNINCLCCLKYPPCGPSNCALNPGLTCRQVGGRRHCQWIKANNTPEALAAHYNVNCSRLPN
jgi:hypothetical protein